MTIPQGVDSETQQPSCRNCVILELTTKAKEDAARARQQSTKVGIVRERKSFLYAQAQMVFLAPNKSFCAVSF